MSDIENKKELIDELLSDAASIASGTTNTEMPVLEDIVTAQSAGTSSDFSVSTLEIVNTSSKSTEETDDNLGTISNKERIANTNLPQETSNDVEPQNTAEVKNGMRDIVLTIVIILMVINYF